MLQGGAKTPAGKGLQALCIHSEAVDSLPLTGLLIKHDNRSVHAARHLPVEHLL
jgi:hypothetical protein